MVSIPSEQRPAPFDPEIAGRVPRYGTRGTASEAAAPTIVDITENGDDGPILSVGVGREDSVLVWVEYREGEPVSMVSRGGRVDELPLVQFAYAGQASGYPPNALIPKEQAWEAAIRFFDVRSLPDNVSWEPV